MKSQSIEEDGSRNEDDLYATSNVPLGSAAGALGIDGENEARSTDKEPTHADDDGGGDHGRRHSRDVSRKEETWIDKNKKVRRGADGWRQTQPTAHAVRDATHVWKLSRDSENAPAYEALTDRQERVDFLKRHGVAKRR